MKILHTLTVMMAVLMMHTESVAQVVSSVCHDNPSLERAAQKRGEKTLKSIGIAEAAFFAENDFYTTDLYLTGWLPQGVQHHVIGFLAPAKPLHEIPGLDPERMNSRAIFDYMLQEGMDPPFTFNAKVKKIWDYDFGAPCPLTGECTVYKDKYYEAYSFGDIDCDTTLDQAILMGSLNGTVYTITSNDLNTRTPAEWRMQFNPVFSAFTNAQAAYRAELGKYTSDLRFLGWLPGGGEIAYKYGFISAGNKTFTNTDQLWDYLMKTYPAPPYSYNGNNAADKIDLKALLPLYCPDCVVTADSYKFIAIGNLDEDAQLDIWTVYQKAGESPVIEQLENDL